MAILSQTLWGIGFFGFFGTVLHFGHIDIGIIGFFGKVLHFEDMCVQSVELSQKTQLH